MSETTGKDKKRGNAEKGQQTLFQMGLLAPNMLPAEDSPGPSVLEELEETVESPVCDPLKEEGADAIPGKPHKEVPLENKTDSDVGLDIGCITNEFPSEVEIEKYISSGHIPLPKQFPKDLNNQTFPESTLKL